MTLFQKSNALFNALKTDYPNLIFFIIESEQSLHDFTQLADENICGYLHPHACRNLRTIMCDKALINYDYSSIILFFQKRYLTLRFPNYENANRHLIKEFIENRSISKCMRCEIMTTDKQCKFCNEYLCNQCYDLYHKITNSLSQLIENQQNSQNFQCFRGIHPFHYV